MVYLSELNLDPLRREAIRVLGDTYALHRALLRAFPDAPDGGNGRILFRAETDKGHARLLVQSVKQPEWTSLSGIFINVRGPKVWEPTFITGQILRFRLRANMTFKQKSDSNPKNGTRHAWRTREEQAAWLTRKGKQHGFVLVPIPSGDPWFDPFADEPEARAEVRLITLPARTGCKSSLGSRPLVHAGIDCDGLLQVTDPTLFTQAVIAGVGPAKAFGFGLLSVAPAR